MADCILAPYQRHVGSSGIMVRAAAASRPVLSQSFGLMCRLTETSSLGVTCDTTSTEELPEGIHRCIHNPVESYFDASTAREFAEANTAEAFARTLLSQILGHEELA